MVEHDRHRRADRLDRGHESWHDPDAASASGKQPCGRGAECCNRVDCGSDRGPERDGIVVGLVARHPRHSWGHSLRPLRQDGRLSVAGRCDDGYDWGVRGNQTLDEGGSGNDASARKGWMEPRPQRSGEMRPRARAIPAQTWWILLCQPWHPTNLLCGDVWLNVVQTEHSWPGAQRPSAGEACRSVLNPQVPRHDAPGASSIRSTPCAMRPAGTSSARSRLLFVDARPTNLVRCVDHQVAERIGRPTARRTARCPIRPGGQRLVRRAVVRPPKAGPARPIRSGEAAGSRCRRCEPEVIRLGVRGVLGRERCGGERQFSRSSTASSRVRYGWKPAPNGAGSLSTLVPLSVTVSPLRRTRR